MLEDFRLTLRYILICIGLGMKYVFLWPALLIMWIFPDETIHNNTTAMIAAMFALLSSIAWSAFFIVFIYWLLGGR